MRIKEQTIKFLKNKIRKVVPGAEIYLFGSRVDDQARGGDIDLLILSAKRVDPKTIRGIKRDFFKKFGWQKVDIVSFCYSDQSPFKQLVLSDGIKL